MIDRATFDLIKRKYGQVGSWAVWPAPGEPQDPSHLDPDAHPDLLPTLRNDVVMLGLNQSGRPIPLDFGNFNELRPGYTGQNRRFALAFFGTPYWGAYMTDLFKIPRPWSDGHRRDLLADSGAFVRYLESHPELVHESLRQLREELDDLGGPPPTMLAFGGHAYDQARKHLQGWYADLKRVTHYSARGGLTNEEYRDQVRADLHL